MLNCLRGLEIIKIIYFSLKKKNKNNKKIKNITKKPYIYAHVYAYRLLAFLPSAIISK